MARHCYRWVITRVVSTVILTLLATFQIMAAQILDDRIVFMSDRDGNREIYTMNPDGSAVHRLTNNDAQDLQPTWSPDKSEIAFVSNRDGDFGIYVMSADGSGVRRVAGGTGTGTFYEYPAWSPNGSQIAYSSDEARSFDLYVVNSNGGEPRRLTSSDEDETDPSWAPDGSQIVYLQTAEGVYQVFVINASGGSGQSVVEQAGAGDFFSPRWSPDGKSLAYATTIFDSAGNLSEIYIQNLADRTEHLLVSAEDSFISGISWSADSHELVYTARITQGKWAINRIDRDGRSTQVLTSPDVNTETPAWSTPRITGEVIHLASPGNAPLSTNRYNVITYARINTLYGETLNLRAEPSINATILEELPVGAVVSVVGESVNRGGYRWWQVQSPTGVVGWSVEAADNVRTLLFANNLAPSLIIEREKITQPPRFSYAENVYGLANGEIWTRPNPDFGRIVEHLSQATAMEVSGMVFAGHLADGTAAWWYLVRVPGESEARGWMPEHYLSKN